MTQDIGTAIQRERLSRCGGMVYTVGKTRLSFQSVVSNLKNWALIGLKIYFIYHMECTGKKMKSREGTVVDADDLMQEMTETAQKIAEDLGK
jgi:arginyl-tRNA synthetase